MLFLECLHLASRGPPRPVRWRVNKRAVPPGPPCWRRGPQASAVWTAPSGEVPDPAARSCKYLSIWCPVLYFEISSVFLKLIAEQARLPN